MSSSTGNVRPEPMFTKDVNAFVSWVGFENSTFVRVFDRNYEGPYIHEIEDARRLRDFLNQAIEFWEGVEDGE